MRRRRVVRRGTAIVLANRLSLGVMSLVAIGLAWRWVPFAWRESRDVLSGAKVTTSSDYGVFLAPSMFFHTDEEDQPSLTFELARSTIIASLRVENTASFRERAYPLIAEVSTDGAQFREVGRVDHVFARWEPRFAPVSARFLRLRVLKRTWFHLRRVQAFS